MVTLYGKKNVNKLFCAKMFQDTSIIYLPTHTHHVLVTHLQIKDVNHTYRKIPLTFKNIIIILDCIACSVTITEMPTSRDLKSGDCLFFTPPLPPRKIDLAPNGNDLGHYMSSYMMYILSKLNSRNNLCQGQKYPRNSTVNKKNSSFELKMG